MRMCPSLVQEHSTHVHASRSHITKHRITSRIAHWATSLILLGIVLQFLISRSSSLWLVGVQITLLTRNLLEFHRRRV